MLILQLNKLVIGQKKCNDIFFILIALSIIF